MTEQTEEQENSHLDNLIEILHRPEKRILPLLYPSKNEEEIRNRKVTREELVKISQNLFREIEDLYLKYHQVTKKKNGDDDDDDAKITLTGLPELYIPPGDALDAETMWGQVDLQNKALRKLMKKSTKRLANSPEDIVVLDMGQVMSSDEGDSDENSSDEDDMKVNNDTEGSGSGSGSEEDEDEDEDEEEAKRIRERMERAMEDIESDEDNDDNEEEKKAVGAKSGKSEELYDPVAEDLKDGFFDLNEMEDFADEEEDFLPDEAFGKPEKKKKGEKKSFHQKQRDGDFLGGSDGEDDDQFDEMDEEEEPVKRKKYREDDEIEALFSMYQQTKEDDEDDVVNMTAADIFGKPKKNHYERYYKKKEQINNRALPKEDDDSWGEYDFEKEDEGAWRDEHLQPSKAKDSSEDDDSGDDGEEPEDEESDAGGRRTKKQAQKKGDSSMHGKQTEKLRRQTEELEKELLAEKPWHMTGETKSTARPVNSLLEGTPEFDMASKQAPVITVQHTANLEEIIKKRIIAEDWDDVVPRELPDVGWHKKRGELPEVSQEKSKLGLGELYEREYLKKAVGYDKDAAEKQTEEEKVKDEMKQLFANLCSKLDALSNYHFAPRPISDEAEVRAVTAPAIAMEEVLPLHVSDARGVAPEEVYGTKRGREGILRAESEMDQVRMPFLGLVSSVLAKTICLIFCVLLVRLE